MQEGTIFLVVLCCGNYSSNQYKVYFRIRCMVVHGANVYRKTAFLPPFSFVCCSGTVSFYILFSLHMQKKKVGP